jgi:hypothetical protein
VQPAGRSLGLTSRALCPATQQARALQIRFQEEARILRLLEDAILRKDPTALVRVIAADG